MKDAFGGAFMLRILIVFFVVFVCFMTVAISYVRVYRIKNNVISILEREDNYNDAATKIGSYLQSIDYQYVTNESVINECAKRVEATDNVVKTFNVAGGNANGVCIVPYGEVIDGIYKYHYQVTAYIVLDFPLFHLGTVVPISGETRPLYMGASS